MRSKKVKRYAACTFLLANRTYSRILGIVVLDVFAADGTSVVEQLEIGNRFNEIRGIPVHVFRECDFRIIAKEQDTLPDSINYLNVREKLLGGAIHVPLVTELDLFGLFKTRYPVIEGYLNGNGNGTGCGAGPLAEGSQGLSRHVCAAGSTDDLQLPGR